MRPKPPPEPHDAIRGELQIQALGQNLFVVTLIGAVAFVAACLSVLAR